MKESIACSVVFALVLGFFSCEKSDPEAATDSMKTEQSQLFHSVTEKEYAGATLLQKRIIDQIDASVNALNIMAHNKEFANYEAIASVSSDASDKFSNSIIIAPVENVTSQSTSRARMASGGDCHICGVRSAYASVRAAEKYMDDHHKDLLDVHIVRKADGCVDVHYQ